MLKLRLRCAGLSGGVHGSVVGRRWHLGRLARTRRIQPCGARHHLRASGIRLFPII